ncbi:MAG: plastocyanin/azurin family copper-binding protein [Pseudolabrys sp.]
MLKTSIAVAAVAVALAATSVAAWSHDGPKMDKPKFAAGEPGDPKKPARTVKVVMREDGKKMLFEPARIDVRKGEQIRFVLDNAGAKDHEFVLATVKENKLHAAEMKKNPHMEHDDPNAKQLAASLSGEILWKFTKAGTFEYACLIPGHYEAGMHGTVVVK